VQPVPDGIGADPPQGVAWVSVTLVLVTVSTVAHGGWDNCRDRSAGAAAQMF